MWISDCGFSILELIWTRQRGEGEEGRRGDKARGRKGV